MAWNSCLPLFIFFLIPQSQTDISFFQSNVSWIAAHNECLKQGGKLAEQNNINACTNMTDLNFWLREQKGVTKWIAKKGCYGRFENQKGADSLLKCYHSCDSTHFAYKENHCSCIKKDTHITHASDAACTTTDTGEYAYLWLYNETEILTNSTVVFNCSYIRCTDRTTVDEQDIKYTDDCKQQLNGFACVSEHKSDQVKPEEQSLTMSFATTIEGALESSTMALQHISTSPRENSYSTKIWTDSSLAIQSSIGSSVFSPTLSYHHFGKSIVKPSLISITKKSYNMISTTVKSLDATNKDVTESSKISLIQSTTSRNSKSSSSQYTADISFFQSNVSWIAAHNECLKQGGKLAEQTNINACTNMADLNFWLREQKGVTKWIAKKGCYGRFENRNGADSLLKCYHSCDSTHFAYKENHCSCIKKDTHITNASYAACTTTDTGEYAYLWLYNETEILTNSTVVFNCSYIRCTDRTTVDEQDIRYTDDCKQQLNGFACVSEYKSDKVKPEEQSLTMSFATTIEGALEYSTMALQHISTSPRENSYSTKIWTDSSLAIQSSIGSSDFSPTLSYHHFGKSIVTPSLISITKINYNMISTTVKSLDTTNKDVTESSKISLIQSTTSRNSKSSSSQYTGLIIGLLVSLFVIVVIVAIFVCRLRHTRPFRKENIANDNKISLKNISKYQDVDPNSEKGTTYSKRTTHDTSANNGNRMQFKLEHALNNTRNLEDENAVVVKKHDVASGKENADRNDTSKNADSLDVQENNYDLLNQEIRPSDIESGNIYDTSRGFRDVYDTTQHVNSNKNKDESVYDHT